MLEIILAICMPTQIINQTDKPWNTQDQEHLERAQKRCGEIYKNSPCCKIFYKKSESDYSAICGAKNE